MAEQTAQSNGAAKKTIGRGVSYPFINLQQAIEKARVFHREERKSAAPVASAMKHFGYSATSSGGRQTVATLIQFGLLEDEGRSDNRHVKLTDRALTTLLAEEGSRARQEALQEAVRMPKLYGHLIEKYKVPDEELPSDHTISFYLQKEFDFNPKTLKAFIDDFRASLALAKLSPGSTIPPNGADNDSGDSEFDGGDAVSNAVAERKDQDAVGSPKPALLSMQGHATTVLVTPGEREWLRGPLSREAGYRLLVTGQMGPREIGKLIKLLEAQKAVLDDDDGLDP